jgi:hypothetical protein
VDEKQFDDNDILKKQKCTNYKISRIRVVENHNHYVTGIQMEYKNLDTDEIIEGSDLMC